MDRRWRPARAAIVLQSRMYEDTIVARATPPGTGALAIVRLSGPEAIAIVDACVRLRTPLANLRSHRCRLGELFDGDLLLDQVVVTLFRAPRSYTGEDMVEITCHGGPYVTTRLVRLLQRGGARPAREGEFTLRAYLNGKMDLAQAEAVAALISARSAAGARAAMRILSGGLRASLEGVLSDLTRMMAAVEAYLDIEEDGAPDVLVSEVPLSDVPAPEVPAPEVPASELVPPTRVPSAHEPERQSGSESRAEAIRRILQKFQSLASSGRAGRLLEEGVRIALVGCPNAGKSSLFNAFLARDRAIVSPEAGTTRDALEAWVEWDGLPVTLLDTAGLHIALGPGAAAGPHGAGGPGGFAEPGSGRSVLEQEGQRRTWEALASATLVVLVLDASRESPEALSVQVAELESVLEKNAVYAPAVGGIVVALHKWDLGPHAGWERAENDRVNCAGRPHDVTLEEAAGGPPSGSANPPAIRMPTGVSALVPSSVVAAPGTSTLKAELMSKLRDDVGEPGEALLVGDRQRGLVDQATAALQQALRMHETGEGDELIACELRAAMDAVGEMLGRRTGPLILEEIFSRFCVGK